MDSKTVDMKATICYKTQMKRMNANRTLRDWQSSKNYLIHMLVKNKRRRPLF